MNDDQQLIPRPGHNTPPSTRPPWPGYMHEQEPYDSADLGLSAYLQIVRKHLFMILAFTLISTTVTAFYMARKPDVYGAEVRVQIDLENNPAIGVSGKPVVINPASAPDYFETQLEILRGSGLLRRVVKTLDLEHNRSFFIPQEQRTTWQRLREMAGLGGGSINRTLPPMDQNVLMTSSVAPPTDREDLAEIKRLNPYVGTIQGALEVEQVGHTRLVEIRFTHLDPQVAAKVVNALADTFVLSNLEKMTETNAGAAAFLKKRIADLQGQIRNGEERLINYAKDHQIISLDQNQNTVVERLNGLNRQLLTAENDRQLAEAAYRAALAPNAADALAAGGSLQSAADGKLSELRQRLAQLRVEYTPKWPEIKVIEGEIAELEKQAAQSKASRTSQLLQSLETRYLETQQRERAVRTAFEQQRNETITQNSAAVNYRILQQEIQTNQELLNGLWQRSKENDVILAGTPNNIHVADYANTPERPIGPQRTRGVGMAFAFSLVFGIGLSLLRELTNNTVRTTEDVSRKVRLPTIAVVPKVTGWGKRKLLTSPKVLLQLNGRIGNSRPLLKYGDDSRLAEVYRKLRTTVMLSRPGPPRTLLVTSSVPAEGKTTTAVNMATVLAQTGANVLIIDADMRKPTLHEIFNLDNKRGLSTLLATKSNEAETLSLIQQDNSTGLHILPAGPPTSRPAELLSSDHMRHLLEIAAGLFTHIVIDSTPVISFTDSVLIARLVDGVILVVQGGKSPYEIVQHSRRELFDVGANIVGVVLNNVDIAAQDSYYYYQPLA